MPFLLYLDQGSIFSSAAGTATGQSTVAAVSKRALPPIGLLLLFEDNPNVITNIRTGLGSSFGTSSVNSYSGPIRPVIGFATGTSSALARTPLTFAAIGDSSSVSFVTARGVSTSVAVGEHFLPAPLKVEFAKASFTLFTAIKIQYRFYAFHVLDSAGYLNINGEIYTGADPQHGSLLSIDAIPDGTGDDAPSVRIILLPPDAIASFNLIAENVQGAIVQIFVGAVDSVYGTLIGYQQVFLGEVDVATLEVDEQVRQVTIDCVSVFERFFDDEEGVRLTDSWHQSIWPGEQGLIYVTDIERTIPWGADSPLIPPVSTTPSSSTNYNFPGIGLLSFVR